MRRLVAWLGGALGGIALYRAATRRGPVGTLPAPEPVPLPEPEAEALPAAEGDRRADELRRKLEESRLLVEERESFESGETPVDEAHAVEDPEARRRRVHEEARAQVERMQRE